MKRAQQNVINPNSGRQLYEFIYLLALTLIIVLSAFIGVYYNEEYLTVHILSALCVLGCLFIYKKKNVVLASSVLDYILLAFTLLYIISIAWSAQISWSVEESLKYINYFLLYWLVAKVLNDHQIHSIMKIFVVLGAALSLIGVLSYLGIIPFEGAVQGWRITATLKYPNALGSFLLATIALAHFDIGERKNEWLYNLGLYIMVVAFIGTFSRANYLLSLPVIIGVYIAYPGDKKKAIANSMILLLGGISVSIIIYSNTIGIYIKLIMFILGFVAAGLSSQKKIVVTGILVLFTLLIMVIPHDLLPGKEENSRFEPESKVVGRIQEIDLEETNAQVRFIFFGDALELIKENLLIGKGGGAWRALYPFKMSYLYYTKDPHSYPLRIGTETGLIGLVLFLSLLIYVFINTIWYGKKENRIVGFAIAALFLHGFVDFDFSIGFISIAAWILLGVFNNHSSKMKVKELVINKWVLFVSASIFLLISTMMLLSTYYSNLGDKISYDEVAGKLSKAIVLYPLNSQNYGTLADVNYQAYKLSGDRKNLDLALLNIDKAIKTESLNYNWQLDKAFYLVERGDREQAINVLKSNYDLIPKFQNNVYARAAYVFRMAAQGYLEDAKTEKAKQTLEEIIQLWHRAQEEISTVPEEYYSLWREEEIVTEFDPFLLEVINAHDFLGEKEKAKALLQYLSQETVSQHDWLQEI